MSQETTLVVPRRVLFVQFTLSVPSEMNGAAENERNNLTGLFMVDASTLRSTQEIAMVAGLRLGGLLDTLVTAVDKVTAEHNEQHPLPKEQPAEEEKEGDDTEFQA